MLCYGTNSIQNNTTGEVILLVELSNYIISQVARDRKEDAPWCRQNLFLRKKKNLILLLPPSESLPPSGDVLWPTWKALKRMRTQIGRCKHTLCK